MLAFTPTTDRQEIQRRRNTLDRLYATFSDTGKGYASLNKTLSHFQDFIDEPLLRNLKHVHLIRAITDRLELFTLLYAIEESRKHEQVTNPLWLRATRPQVVAAANKLPGPFDPNDPASISLFVMKMVFSEPPDYAGTIAGLAEVTNKTMRKMAIENRRRIAARYDPGTKLASPGPMPSIKGVTFIGTVGELWAEGERLKNCAVEYAEQAITGECYFFHVEKDGAEATARLWRNGEYLCDGKEHTENAATRWEWWRQ